jgi:Rrf2 family transcriptional regulator, cysteine metabolism repressor
MRLSTRTRYGARAMLEIARHRGRATKRREIARNQGVSDGYLENILIALKAHGLVRTTRGAQGGFTLARSPESITLLDVFSALDGDPAPVECVDSPARCTRSSECLMRPVYEQLKTAQEQVLRSTTLQGLLESADGEPDFCI